MSNENENFSAVRLFIHTFIYLFFAELVVMFFLTYLPPMPHLLEGFIDSFCLVIFTLPILYYNLYRPMVLHIKERKRSEKEKPTVAGPSFPLAMK